MEVIARHVLQEFKQTHPEVGSEVDALLQELVTAKWQNPHELRARYPKASLLKNNHVVLDIKGNRYRLHIRVFYDRQIIIIKRFGTHQQYNKWKFEDA